MQVWSRQLIGLMSLLLVGCVGLPAGLEPVVNFDAARYLGQWHEIARLDHRFERGLSRVTASYVRRPDGGITVINRGFAAETQTWRAVRGRAYFVKDPGTGWLKVSFWGPFYGAYVILELDPGYTCALVAGPSRDYLWILSRSPQMDPACVSRLVGIAEGLGFDTARLIFATGAVR